MISSNATLLNETHELRWRFLERLDQTHFPKDTLFHAGVWPDNFAKHLHYRQYSSSRILAVNGTVRIEFTALFELALLQYVTQTLSYS